MAEPGVRYTVRVDKEGTGAQAAAAELVTLGQAATGAKASLASMNTVAAAGSVTATQSFSRLQQQTAVMQGTFKALDGTLRIIGFSTFPQITLAVTTAVDGMRALTNAARIAAVESAKAATAAAGGNVLGAAAGGAIGSGGGAAGNALAGAAGGAAAGGSLRAGFGIMARTAGPVAVIAGGAYKIGQYVSELWGYGNDLDRLEQSLQDVEESAKQTGEALLKLAETRMASGDLNLSEESADAIDKLIAQQNFRGARAAIDSNTRPSFFMTESQKAAEVRERMRLIDQDNRWDDAINAPFRTTRTGTGKQEEMDLVNKREKADREAILQLQREGFLTEKQSLDLQREGEIARRNSITDIKSQMTDMEKLGQRTVGMFAGGFSQAFVDFASGAKSAKEAFTDFARSFLSQIAQMIMEQLILNAISGILGGGKAAASGGVFPQMMAAGGMAGVSEVSRATYFPKFNVVAGEAGREMLTVLARPRMMEIGGMQAVVGNAGSNRLAITSADELASRGGGAGGVLDIRVTLGPELRAEIVNQAVRGAQVRVAQDMREDSPISRGVKGLTA